MKKIKLKFLFLLFTFSVNVYSQTSFLSGNELHNQINSQNQSMKSIALGYITGVVDSKFPNCVLQNVTTGQIRDSVKKYLEDNPNQRQYSASSIVENVMKRDYGCR